MERLFNRNDSLIQVEKSTIQAKKLYKNLGRQLKIFYTSLKGTNVKTANQLPPLNKSSFSVENKFTSLKRQDSFDSVVTKTETFQLIFLQQQLHNRMFHKSNSCQGLYFSNDENFSICREFESSP